MREAFTGSQLDVLRNRPQFKSMWFAVVHRPLTVAKTTLANPVQTYPGSAINVNTITAGDIDVGLTGASALIEAGMTMLVGTTVGGSEKGRIRVRRPVTEASVIRLAEFGCGLINWQIGDHITILEQFLPWTKHPRYDTDASQWRMDWDEGYTNQLENYGPYVNMTGATANFADTLHFMPAFETRFRYYANRTLFFDGATVNSTTWTFPPGLVADDVTKNNGLASADDPILISTDGAQGAENTNYLYRGRYVKLAVTDSNGVSAVGRRLIFLMPNQNGTQSNNILPVEFGQISGGHRRGGYEAEIRTTQSNASTIKDMSEIIIFERVGASIPPPASAVSDPLGTAGYTTSPSTIGGNYRYRENIVMRGWVLGDTIRVNPFSNDVTFKIATIDGILRETESRDVFLKRSNPPTSASHWVEAQDLTVDRTALFMLKHRSTVSELVDFYPASGVSSEQPISYQSLPKANFWSQLQANYGDKGVGGYISADLQSNLYAEEDAILWGTSANKPLAMHIEQQDKRDQVVIEEQPFDKVSEQQVYSVILSGGEDIKVGAISPGHVMGNFGQQQEIGTIVVDSQDRAITIAGNARARANNKFPRVIVPLAGNYRIDSVPQSRITMSMSATENPKAISWNDEQFIPYETKINYLAREGAVLTEIEMERIVNGIGGSSITFPEIVAGTTPPPPPIPPPPGGTPTQGNGFGTVYVVTDDTIGRTRNFGASSPSWTNINGVADGYTFYDFILDPWNPKQIGYLSTSNGLYKSIDLDVASPTWTLVLSKTTIEATTGKSDFRDAKRIFGSINQQNYIAMFFTLFNYQIWCAVSEDGGTSWNFTSIGPDGQYEFFGAADIVPHTINGSLTLYCIVRSTPNVQMYKSTNKGYSWSLVYSAAFTQATGITLHCPYNGNTDGRTVLWNVADVSSPTFESFSTYRSTDGGVTNTLILDIGSGPSKRGGVETYTQDKNIISVPVLSVANLGNARATDGTNFVTTQIDLSTSTDRHRAGGGFPYNNSQHYKLTTGGIYVSTDNWSTLSTKTGDWSWGFTITRGNGVIVPVWVGE